MEHRELSELTAAYALDALDPAEAREYEEHLARCSDCRVELMRLQEVARALAYGAAPVEPPQALRERVLETARAEQKQLEPRRLLLELDRPRWAYPALAFAALAACTAIGFGVWAVTLHSQLGARSALRTLPLNGVAGALVVDGRGQAVLVVDGLGPAPAGKTYEAWVLRSGQAYPAGIFGSNGRVTSFRLTRTLSHGSSVAVTLERAGGSRSPTAKPLLSSAAT
jgi:anti-sigma-K factor RskA